jgi:hypothetical protein
VEKTNTNVYLGDRGRKKRSSGPELVTALGSMDTAPPPGDVPRPQVEDSRMELTQDKITLDKALQVHQALNSDSTALKSTLIPTRFQNWDKSWSPQANYTD